MSKEKYNKFFKSFEESFDRASYDISKTLIGVLAILCMVFITWVSLLWGLGCLFRLQIKEGVIALLVSLLSAMFSRGGGKIIEILEKNN